MKLVCGITLYLLKYYLEDQLYCVNVIALSELGIAIILYCGLVVFSSLYDVNMTASLV